MLRIVRDFIEKTKYQNLSLSGQELGDYQPPLFLPPPAGQALIDLPEPSDIRTPAYSLRQAIENRRSIREYASRPLSLSELSLLLWCTQGVQRTIEDKASLRPVPSAGARHPLETWLLINHVNNIPSGLYRYWPPKHKLIVVNTQSRLADKISEACLRQKFVTTAGAVFFWTAIPNRTSWRYSERGYRYLLMETGHVCQNLYLACSLVDCGCCAIASFLDDELNNILKIDGSEQFCLYAATVGKLLHRSR